MEMQPAGRQSSRPEQTRPMLGARSLLKPTSQGRLGASKHEPNRHQSTSSLSKNKKLFPQKLWDLINDQRYSFCLRWSDDGQLVYLNRDKFEDCYLRTQDNQFHTQKAISFVRQMNMYGFKKVDDCYYENHNFKKDCEHLLKNMIRKHTSKQQPQSQLQLRQPAGPIRELAHSYTSHHQHLSTTADVAQEPTIGQPLRLSELNTRTIFATSPSLTQAQNRNQQLLNQPSQLSQHQFTMLVQIIMSVIEHLKKT